MYVCMDAWMDGWMDVCMYVCMYGWMDGWMCVYMYSEQNIISKVGEGGSKNSAVADGGMFLFSRNSVKDIVK